MIKKEDLKDGIYYVGVCRNARIALWDVKKNKFIYIRDKFGYMMDTIEHFSDVKDTSFDGFIPIREVEFATYKEERKEREDNGY